MLLAKNKIDSVQNSLNLPGFISDQSCVGGGQKGAANSFVN